MREAQCQVWVKETCKIYNDDDILSNISSKEPNGAS